MSIPLIDFAQVATRAAGVDACLADIGFLQLANIGIDPALREAVFATSSAFFYAAPQVKAASAYRSASENFGYQGLFEENLNPDAPPDIKESFTMRNIVAAPPALDRWPSAEFRDLMVRFFADTLAAAHGVQRAMAV